MVGQGVLDWFHPSTRTHMARWKTSPDRMRLAELLEMLGLSERACYGHNGHPGLVNDPEVLDLLDADREQHGRSFQWTVGRAAAERYVKHRQKVEAEERGRRRAAVRQEMRDRFNANQAAADRGPSRRPRRAPR